MKNMTSYSHAHYATGESFAYRYCLPSKKYSIGTPKY